METKSKEMAEEMDNTIVKLNEEASALESEKEKKSVSLHNFPPPSFVPSSFLEGKQVEM